MVGRAIGEQGPTTTFYITNCTFFRLRADDYSTAEDHEEYTTTRNGTSRTSVIRFGFQPDIIGTEFAVETTVRQRRLQLGRPYPPQKTPPYLDLNVAAQRYDGS